MNALVIILLAIPGLIILALLVGLLMKKEHYVSREIVINTTPQKVFDFLRFVENQEKFNKHAMVDGDRDKSFSGTDGTVGFVYSWKGNKDAGEGEKEITRIVDGELVEMEIRFVKPLKTSATMTMKMGPPGAEQTKLTWSNAGTLRYPVNIMIPMMERMVGKSMNESLQHLKTILEN